jgi:hypothetical protein
MYSVTAGRSGYGRHSDKNREDPSSNHVITELIDKSKILTEELKNSNRITANLMEENNGLRSQYTKLKTKFLSFLAE